MVELTWGVGAVADRLGIPAPTLRTWERRYSLGPSHRTDGGHRRYTSHDIDRVVFMQQLLEQGVPPREAAELAVVRPSAAGLADTEALSNEELVEAILEGAKAIDPERLGALFGGVLAERGVIAAWDEVFAPALVAVGNGWADGSVEVVGEHLTSERLLAELRAHVRVQSVDRTGTTVVLASAADDLHSLPLTALEAALAERGARPFLLGARVPWSSLTELVERIDPEVVFLWATLERQLDRPFADAMAAMPARTRLLIGGPGWTNIPVSRGARVGSLAEALYAIEQPA